MNRKKYTGIYDYSVEEKVSDIERIIKTNEPVTKRNVFVHQFFDGKKWQLCTHCGDMLKIPHRTARHVYDIEHIRKYCSAYKSSLNSKI